MSTTTHLTQQSSYLEIVNLTGPVTAVRSRYANKQVIVAFPPDRVSKQLRQVATASFVLGRKKLRDSQLPERVISSDGHVLEAGLQAGVELGSLMQAQGERALYPLKWFDKLTMSGWKSAHSLPFG